MNELASRGHLRAEFVRWALFLVPGIILLGYLSAMISMSGPQNPWFASLNKPAIYPPPMTFSLVWTALYALMGLSAALIAGRLRYVSPLGKCREFQPLAPACRTEQHAHGRHLRL